MSNFAVDWSDFDRLNEAILHCRTNAEEAMNDALHNTAGGMMMNAIQPLIHASGRKWKGKAPSATKVMPFAQQDGNLSVTIGTIKNKKKYQYLYFPDDGSNTYSHAGNQDFMGRGVENVTEDIIDLCIEKLLSNFDY